MVSAPRVVGRYGASLAGQRSETSHTYFIVSELVACFPALQSA